MLKRLTVQIELLVADHIVNFANENGSRAAGQSWTAKIVVPMEGEGGFLRGAPKRLCEERVVTEGTRIYFPLYPVLRLRMRAGLALKIRSTVEAGHTNFGTAIIAARATSMLA
jgi:hypothetical protein